MRDEPQAIQQTLDGGFILAGSTLSNDGDVTNNHGSSDCWVIKLSGEGAIIWQKTYGGSGVDEVYSIQKTANGGYVLAGRTFSNDGDVSGNHGDYDYWIVKIDSIGTIEWQKTLGGSGADDGWLVYPALDGGYIVAGTTGSSDGQVSLTYGLGDIWILKLSELGNILWQKTIGGSDQDGPSSLFQTNDGFYILSNRTLSTDGDVLDNDGGADVWVVKLAEGGNIVWQKTFGGTLAEAPSDLQPTTDGGFVFCGYTSSNDGDVSGNHGDNDFWIVKLSPESSATTTPLAYPLAIYPNPAQQSISLQFPVAASALNVCISDVLGRSMIRQTGMITKAGSITLEVSALPAGVYLVSAVDEEGQVFSGRFMRQ
jgi:hypothetical protein